MFDIVNISACSENEECTGLSDRCTSQICMCGVNPMCSTQTSDNCESGTCRCGPNTECNGTFSECISGVCQGTTCSQQFLNIFWHEKYKSVLYLMLYQKLYFNFVDCFEWNEKTWKGTKPSSPVSTVCGLNTCTSCPSKFVMPDL